MMNKKQIEEFEKQDIRAQMLAEARGEKTPDGLPLVLNAICKPELISKINNIVKKRSNSYYPPRSKKVLNLIDGFQTNRIKKCTLGGCIFERKKSLLYVSKEL